MMHHLQMYFIHAGPYLEDFTSPGGSNEAILIAQCDHIIAKSEDLDGNLAELQSAATWMKTMVGES